MILRTKGPPEHQAPQVAEKSHIRQAYTGDRDTNITKRFSGTFPVGQN